MGLLADALHPLRIGVPAEAQDGQFGGLLTGEVQGGGIQLGKPAPHPEWCQRRRRSLPGEAGHPPPFGNQLQSLAQGIQGQGIRGELMEVVKDHPEASGQAGI